MQMQVPLRILKVQVPERITTKLTGNNKDHPSLRIAVSAGAKSFKDKYFPSDSGATEENQKLRSSAWDICASKEETLAELVASMLGELSKGDGVSTFEFIGSGCWWKYGSYGCFGSKASKCLIFLGALPHVLSHSSRSSTGNARLSSGLSALSQPFKLRLCRAQGDKTLRDYSSNVVLIDPLASLAAIEDFLWPRVRVESGQKALASVGNPESGTTARGVGASCPSTSTPASGSAGKGKAVLKPAQDDGRGPQTRNAARRRAALDKEAEVKPVNGESSSEDDELDMSPVEIDDALVIEDEDISDDEEDDHDDVLGDSLPVCMPDKVYDVKLGDSSEDGPATQTPNDSQTNAGMDLTLLSLYGSSYGSRGAMSLAAAAMAGLARNQRREELEIVMRLWGDIYTITYQRADSQAERSTKGDGSSTSTKSNKASSSASASADSSLHRTSLLDSILQGELPCDMEKTNSTYNILALLRVVEGLNQLAPRLHVHKLTPKLARQIQDALALCSGSLPSWCYQLTRSCPFLFPFETRRQYFYSTAFGLSRALYRLQQQQGADGNGSTNEREVRAGQITAPESPCL
ncbi:hypothetical protein HAX54_038834 [Datura stramonium]|uniref:Uncharacterized protein n=1 Tax=Datura stramonium TaxID=4076 RepID=A0ABS8VKD6_DATST|nr:hypothetical protein [Datura stramonium]